MPLWNFPIPAIPIAVFRCLEAAHNRTRLVFSYWGDLATGVGGYAMQVCRLMHRQDATNHPALYSLSMQSPLEVKSATECNLEWFAYPLAVGFLSILEEVSHEGETDLKDNTVRIGYPIDRGRVKTNPWVWPF